MIILIIALNSVFGHAISRVGGGAMSDASNFWAPVPIIYEGGNVTDTTGKTNPNLLILRSTVNRGFNPIESEILLSEFAVAYPKYLTLPPSVLADELEQEGFGPMTLPLIPCAQSWYKVDDGGYHMVIRLGNTQGLTVDGSISNEVLVTLKGIQNGIHLNSGTCGWN